MFDVSDLSKLSDNFKQIDKNVDFASAVALTRTAKLVQAEVKKQLQDKFILRNKWTQSGIRINPAKPDKLEAEIYSKDWYTQQQEEGAERKAKSGLFNIPGEQFYMVTGLDKNRVIPNNMRPGTLLAGRKVRGQKPFEVTFKSGARGIVVRRPGAQPIKKNGKTSAPIDVLYVRVEQSIHIRARKFFFEPAEDVYNKYFQEEYDRAWNEYILKGMSL